MQNVFYDILIEEKKKGTTILYSTHILSEVTKICDRIGFIKDGKIIKEDTVLNILNNTTTYLTIESKDINQIKKDLKLNVIFEDNNTVKFINNIKTNELLKKLTKYDIKKILIEEPTIEDLFIGYYK